MHPIPPITHVISRAIIRRQRRLPVPGNIPVRVNRRVQAADIVAEAEVGGRHVFIDISRGLGVAENQVEKLLVRELGERVDAGDVLAGPVGIAHRTVRAPASGRIVHLSGGRLLLALRGRTLEIRAGVPGMIVSTDGTQEVSIETEGALIQGLWGNGKQNYGLMNMVGEGPGGRMKTDLLDINLRGAILIAGICDHPAPLHQATELQAHGLILGSLSSELIPVARKLPYPVLISEGFGDMPLNPRAFEILKENLGREASIDARPYRPFDGHKPEVIIPLQGEGQGDLEEDFVPLAPGVTVRGLRSPYLGKVGLVRELQPYGTVFPSGIIARCAKVELEGIGVVEIPLANLEVLQ